MPQEGERERGGEGAGGGGHTTNSVTGRMPFPRVPVQLARTPAICMSTGKEGSRMEERGGERVLGRHRHWSPPCLASRS